MGKNESLFTIYFEQISAMMLNFIWIKRLKNSYICNSCGINEIRISKVMVTLDSEVAHHFF